MHEALGLTTGTTYKLGMVVDTYNPRTQVVENRRSRIHRVQFKAILGYNTLSSKKRGMNLKGH